MTDHWLPPTETRVDCSAFRAHIEDIAADESDAVTQARLDAHAAQCPGCRFALATAKAYRRMMRRVGQSERAPSSLWTRALDVLAQSREPQGPRP